MPAQARFIDIHVLQSVPFSNLNRDDASAVKSVQFGNTWRTRVSSQAWKRAMREKFQEETGESAVRTRRIGERVTRELKDRGWENGLAERAGAHLAAGTGIKFELAPDPNDPKKFQTNKVLTNVMVYVPQTAIGELAEIAEEHRGGLEEAKDITKSKDKSVLPEKRIKEVLRSRNSVINLFGRMLAEVDGAGIEGAIQVAHAFTTHGTDVETDYFAAVDDVTALWEDSTGSGHMGEAEFSAGTFYRYATVDLRDLASNIGDTPAARETVAAFLDAFIRSLPQAKKHSTAPHTIPDLVHFAVRTDRPLSLAAAFEKPVRASKEGGFSTPSIQCADNYARSATMLLGSKHLLANGWSAASNIDHSSQTFGQKYSSYEELISAALEAAYGSVDQPEVIA